MSREWQYESEYKRGFHLAVCSPNDDRLPASSGCNRNCPRFLWWRIEQLTTALAKAQDELGHDQEELL